MNIKLILFLLSIIITGVFLTRYTSFLHSKLSDVCVSKTVQYGLNSMLMLTIMMIVLPVIQLLCYWACGCPQNDLNYKVIIFILLSLLLGSASVVMKGIKSDDNCKLDIMKNYLLIIIVTSGSLLGLGFLTFIPFRKIFKKKDESSSNVSL